MKTIIGREKFLSHFFAFLQQNDFATLVNLSNLVPQHHHHQLCLHLSSGEHAVDAGGEVLGEELLQTLAKVFQVAEK